MTRNLTFTMPYSTFEFTSGKKCNSFNFRKLIFIFSALLPFILSAQDQNNFWSPVSEKDRKFSERSSLLTDVPDLKKGKVLKLQVESMMAMAKTAKNEIGNLRNKTTIIELPLPDGTFQKFQIWESSLMEPELAAKYPEIQSYIIRALDNPLITGRMTVSPYGFGANFTDMVKGQEVVIRKILKDDPTIYLSFWRKDDPANDQPFKCDWQGDAEEHRHEEGHNRMMLPNETGDVLRVFRLAMTVTGSLAQQEGWTSKPQALAAVVTFLGEINTIYERDLSVRFVLPVGEENLLFLDDATDPFTAYGGGESANENIIVSNALIGSENFDIGLVMVTNGCCAAGKPSICSSTKAWNFSRYNNLDVTSHEIGHQFNADHTWTSCGPSNNGQFGTNEYGSGTTIMSYKNNCGVDDIIPAGNLSYFGVYSQIQMTNQINAQSCYKTLNTGNNIPTSTVPASGFHIPVSTPFELAGTGSDADGDPLTYSWEQVNIRNIDFTATTISIQTPPTPADGNVPIQRMFYPSPSPRRTIPQLSDLLSNTSTVYERLPTYTRNIKYRMYVRDNHPGCGGTTHQEVSFQVDGTAGPFLVTAPNTNVTWQQGSSQTVTWDVANTTNVNVNCQNVKISLSLDGGYNYEYVLAASTPNDGTQNITLPSGVCSNTSRIKVEAVGNIFFDISNTNFTIENSTVPVKAEMLTLDGTNDQIEIQSTTMGNFGTGNFTIEMWVKTTDLNSTLITKRPACDCDNFWHFNIKTGKITAEFISNNLCNNQVEYIGTNTTVADGNWHHVAFVRSGTNILGYVDGVLDINIDDAHLYNFSNSAKIIIGNQVCSVFNSNTHFTGNLDEIRIWNVARTVTEINNNMNCTLAGSESGLLAYYPIEGTTCTASSLTVTDKTSNTNHGIMQNGVIRSLSTKNIPTCPTCTNGNITINSHPTNQSGVRGSTVSYTVNATGNNLSYQWYRSTNGGTSFDILVGATMATYAHTISSGQNSYQFRCLISNGCDIQQTNAATLSMTCSAQTINTITGPASPCQDNYYTYYVNPNINIATWNWTTPSGWTVTYFGNMIFVKPSATSGNVSITGTDYCGNNTNTQSFAVTPVLVQITTQPVSQTVTEGTNVNFTTAVSGGGGSTNYVWQQSTDGGQTYSNISGANAATYSITSAGLSLDDRKFRCIVSNSCLTDTTNTVTLTVNCSTSAPATPGAIAGGNVICANAVLIYSIDEVPGANSYIWTLPAGWTGTSTTKQITVTANGSGGNLLVRSVNSCGSSANQSLPISMNSGTCRRAVHFDGINDHLSIAQNGQALQGDMTVSFWVKPDILSGQQTLIFNGLEFIISLNGSQVRYKHSDDCCGYDNTVEKTFTGNLTLNTWQNVAVTRTTADRTLKFYLNGNLVNTQTYGASFAQPGNNLENMIFGAGNAGQWLNFKGSLDEIKIWSAARTASEIMEDMICYPVGNESNLKAYYGLENGQPFGNNPSVTNFINAATAYGTASVQNLAMSGPFSNVVSGDLPSFVFKDLDGDGYGGEGITCGYSGVSVSNNLDCNDNNANIHPYINEVCGNTLDDDCDGNTDTEVNKAIHIGGSSKSISCPNLAHSTSFTVEAWVKLDSDNANNIIEWIGGSKYTVLKIGSSGRFQYQSHTLLAQSTNPVFSTGQWTHIAFVHDGYGSNNLKTYVNGVLEWTNTINDAITNTSVKIGNNFLGAIDDFRYWDVALNQTQINDRMNYRLLGNEANLIRYYTMDHGRPEMNNTGLIEVRDRTSNNAHGTLSPGFVLTDSTSNWVTGKPYTLYSDTDNDGYGGTTTWSCGSMATFKTNNYDCNDNNVAIKPSAVESCGNGVDENCNGATDENTLSLHFDGTNDYVTSGTSIGNFGTGNFTIELQLKTSATSKVLLSKRPTCNSSNNFWNLNVNSNGKLEVEMRQAGNINNTIVVSSASINDNNWHHVAVTRNGSSLMVIIDGIIDQSITVSAFSYDNTANLILGNSICNAFFNGQIDEVRIWNVARNVNDINLLKNASLIGNEAGLITYYDFNNGPAIPGGNNTDLTVLDDNSSSNNNGTLVNFALTGNSSNWLGNPVNVNTPGYPSSTPTLCINTALTNITHTTTGATGIGAPTGLPSGVTAAWASNTITISGTPSVSGVFNYSIPLTGGCGTVNATGTITVNAVNTPGTPSSNPTLCINTALIPITRTTTGATGIGSPTGLPAGVNAAWSSNTITISGTPNAVGVFNYSIPLTGGCGSVNATGTITVNINTAGTPSSNPTICINTALTPITRTTTGATGIGTPTGLPTGVTASWSGNVLTVSGIPTVGGAFNYSIPLTGGCGSVNAAGTITVNTFSGYHDNDNDGFGGDPLTTCPVGNWVTNNYDCNDNDSVIKPDATETCGNSVDENCNGIVDENTLSLHFDGTNDQVNANNTFGNFGTGNFTIEFSIKSATPSSNKCIISKRDFCGCVNFWNIIQRNDGKLMVEGSQNASCGNGTNVTSNNIISDNNWHHIAIVRSGTSLKIYIDWIEDINGFSYTEFNNSANIVLGNNTCSGVNFNGQLDEVRIWNVARSANDINLLKNASISGSESGLITYYDFNNGPAIPGGNNAGLTVLDDRSSSNNDGTLVNFVLSGNTGNWLGNPTQPIQSVGLPSSNPTLCINTALTSITRTTTGATGIGTPTGLPPGVTAAWASNTITISGTPTSSSTYNYSIPLTGGCGTVNATGTIIVTPNNTAATVSNTTLCIGTTITSRNNRCHWHTNSLRLM
ncbi:MAG: hypothetical protein IPN49_05585 [Saprospiraceae bacterium]|nr:hypothetical protein [Saprospiraceae bacterium]